jgi:hypothetical protein
MLRTVDGMVYEYKPVPGEFDATVHDLGNGHKEISVRQSRAWVAGWELHADAIQEDKPLTAYEEEQEELERRELNAKRAARRAKSRVRKLCKVMGCDSLLTLTYRENMEDEATCKAHLKEFIRRIRRVLPGFCYVAAFERQKRGAWHVHLATHALPRDLPWQNVKVKSYSVVRALWRSVTGTLGGNIDQSRRKGLSNRSAAKLASYLSKYMIKAFEDGAEWSNRFSSSSCSIPDPIKRRFVGAALADLIAWAYSMVGDGKASPWLSDFKDSFFLTIEGLSKPPPIG